MARSTIPILLVAVACAHAEERTFSVTFDGQLAGELVLNYQRRTDGTAAVSMRSNWHTDKSPPFAFEYRGTESWKDGRLVRLEGLGSEDGHKGGVTLIGGTDAYDLKAGVKEVSVRGEVWAATGVFPPDPDTKPLVVDAITGDVLKCKVEKVGADRLTVDGKGMPVTHFRVTAASTRWDVWYDETQRLAKSARTRDGRTVSTELTRVKRD
jgi:hypothetical protein